MELRKFMRTLAVVLLPSLHRLCAADTTGNYSTAPPFFQITARSLHDLGLQHGKLAARRIAGWAASEEMTNLTRFATGPGRRAFEQLKHDNTILYPHYVDELRGIAEGSGLPLDTIWILNMINELESLQNQKPYRNGEHCSDIFAVARGGVEHGAAHGHNEDWPGSIKDFFYYLKYSPAPGADFIGCAGLVYPGSMVGWAPSWNSHGMYLTQNSLFPKRNRPGGAASCFAQRDAICGAPVNGPRRGLDAVAHALVPSMGWSSGASVNLIDLVAQRMASVEVHGKRMSLYDITESTQPDGTNYSHFNMYKHMEAPDGPLDSPEASTLHRQARVDALPPPRTRDDVIQLLSDSKDKAYPIFRNMTIATLALNLLTGRLDVWCCGHSAADSDPLYTWNLLRHFDANPIATNDVVTI